MKQEQAERAPRVPNDPKTPPASRDTNQALRELAACVRHYREHNNAFERALTLRHERWAARGLFRLVPK